MFDIILDLAALLTSKDAVKNLFAERKYAMVISLSPLPRTKVPLTEL